MAGAFGLARLSDSYGWVPWVGVPAAVGFAIGYVRRFHGSKVGLIALLVALALVGGLATRDYQLGGCFCGPALVIIVAVPTIAAAVVGSSLRELLDPERSNPFLPL